MSRVRAVPALSAAALVVTLAGCSSDPPLTYGPPSTVPASRPAVADGVPTAGAPQIVELTLAGGRVLGDTGTVPVRLDSPVRITVVSDVADRVVVEGYGQTAPAVIGRPSQLDLVADRAGSFPVRLQAAGTVLTTLEVS